MARKVPKGFDIATAVDDFAGERRRIEVTLEGAGLIPNYRRQAMRLFVGDWTLSAIWGTGTYCSGARLGGSPLGYYSKPASFSPDAEVAVCKGDGRMVDLGDDTVAGWVSPAAFLDAVEAAERGDLDALRSALKSKAEVA